MDRTALHLFLKGFGHVLSVVLILLVGCNNPKPEEKKPEKQDDCKVYEHHIKRLEHVLLEVERNADRFENVMYRLTQNYIVIDQKIRLIQKYQTDVTKENLLRRTASEINRFFVNSQILLDSVEHEIHNSTVPQSSMLPILENVRDYLTHQEKLFIEVYGSIQSIRDQVETLKNTISQKEAEIAAKARKVSETEKASEVKEKETRQIFYIVGSKAELDRARVVKKSGGFLGIGGTIQLSDKLEEMFFQKADYNIVKEISLGNTQKSNLITTHPKGTYLILKTPGEWYLKITNPQKFWSASKFLVVEVD